MRSDQPWKGEGEGACSAESRARSGAGAGKVALGQDAAGSRRGWDALREGRVDLRGKTINQINQKTAGGCRRRSGVHRGRGGDRDGACQGGSEKLVPHDRPLPFPWHTESGRRPAARCLSPRAGWQCPAGGIATRDN